ncbi:hypothetical protein GBA52_024762 [Prunus armeniaca]|nr:hypothetical protein GBA52_024762 [Prunus armeniaca]
MTKDDMRKLISRDTELEAYYCLGDVSWFDITYHLFQASMKGQDLATKCHKVQRQNYSNFDEIRPWVLNDDNPGIWLKVDEEQQIVSFVCEESVEMLSYIVKYNSFDPPAYDNDIELEAYYCLGEASMKSQDVATKCHKVQRQNYSNFDEIKHSVLNDDNPGMWLKVDEEQQIVSFVCEESVEMLSYIVKYNPFDPPAYDKYEQV